MDYEDKVLVRKNQNGVLYISPANMSRHEIDTMNRCTLCR